MNSDFYRIKTEWTSEGEDKSLNKTKTEELVWASSYTEAETVANALIERWDRTKYGPVKYEIIKTKISELLYSNIMSTDDVIVAGLITNFFAEADTSGVGLYQVKVYYTDVDVKTAKESHATETIFTPAISNIDAAKIVLDYLKKVGEQRDYVVRDVKYDKAEAILWPSEILNAKMLKMV